MSEPQYALDTPEYQHGEEVEIDREFLEGLPHPRLWRVLVMPIVPKKMSKGGIVLPEDAIEQQKHLTYLGRVLALGPSAFKDPKFDRESVPEIGDYVIYGKYAGQGMIYKGVKLIMLNDDELLADVVDPDTLKVHF